MTQPVFTDLPKSGKGGGRTLTTFLGVSLASNEVPPPTIGWPFHVMERVALIVFLWSTWEHADVYPQPTAVQAAPLSGDPMWDWGDSNSHGLEPTAI